MKIKHIRHKVSDSIIDLMIWQRHIHRESFVFLFFLFLAVIHGVSWGFADTYDHMSNVDVQTYVGLFDFDLDQNPVRRYRVIVPWLAAAVHFVLGGILSALSPEAFPGDFATVMSFLIVNNILMAVFGVLVFRLCRERLGDEGSYWPCVLGVIAFLTSRWTAYLVGSPLVDSLLMVVIGLLLLGLVRRDLRMLILAIYIGPWAKESFVFFLPLLLLAGREHYLKLFVHLCVSAVLILSFRYWFDLQIGADMGESIMRDVSHFDSVGMSIERLCSIHGLYEFFSLGGVWNVFILAGVMMQQVRRVLREQIDSIWLIFAASVFVQALLSNELARMFYMLSPLLALLVAASIQGIMKSHAGHRPPTTTL